MPADRCTARCTEDNADAICTDGRSLPAARCLRRSNYVVKLLTLSRAMRRKAPQRGRSCTAYSLSRPARTSILLCCQSATARLQGAGSMYLATCRRAHWAAWLHCCGSGASPGSRSLQARCDDTRMSRMRMMLSSMANRMSMARAQRQSHAAQLLSTLCLPVSRCAHATLLRAQTRSERR